MDFSYNHEVFVAVSVLTFQVFSSSSFSADFFCAEFFRLKGFYAW